MSMMIDVDLSENQQRGGDVPAGRWDVIIHDLVPATTKKDHTAYWQITFEVIGGHHTPDNSPHLGRYIFDKEPWVMPMVLQAMGYVAKDAKTGKVSVAKDDLLDFPLVIDLGYSAPRPDFVNQDGTPKLFPQIKTVLTVEEADPASIAERIAAAAAVPAGDELPF